MKPTKNKVYCQGCHRPKMLFETEAKAERFIKFNQQEILDSTGYAPIRTYYCKFCGGYHTTSAGLMPSKRLVKGNYTGPFSPFANVLTSKDFLSESLQKSLWVFSCLKEMGKYKHFTKIKGYLYNFIGNLYTPELKISFVDESFDDEVRKYEQSILGIIESEMEPGEHILRTIHRLLGCEENDEFLDINCLRYRKDPEGMLYNIVKIGKYGNGYQISIIRVNDKERFLGDLEPSGVPIITEQRNITDVQLTRGPEGDLRFTSPDTTNPFLILKTVCSAFLRHLCRPEGEAKEVLTDPSLEADFPNFCVYTSKDWISSGNIPDGKIIVPGYFKKSPIGQRGSGDYKWTFVKPFLRNSKNK